MAKRHESRAQKCSKCKQYPEEGTRVRNGLCARCRPPTAKTAPVDPETPPPPATAKPGAQAMAAGGAPAAADPRQLRLPPVFQAELAEAHRKIADLEKERTSLGREIGRLRWAAKSYLDGNHERERFAHLRGGT